MKLARTGDRVTCTVETHAYYSGYGITPVIIFKPGMIGTVVNVAPKVRKSKGPGMDGKDDFLVVEYHAPETDKTERVALCYCNAIVQN